MSAQTDMTGRDDRSLCPGSTSRWHKPSCSSPDIVVESSIPFCRSCQSKPSLQNIISQYESSNKSTAQPPPDESAEDLKLRWPESVPYVNQASEYSESRPAKRIRQTTETECSIEHTTGSTIYPNPLSPNEFRLLCLTDTCNKNYPIHATLETYLDDNYPTYETVSYTWGGEDGDSRFCRPIFIGPYWDVLPQTENCWQLLRFVRPTRRIRFIWVDAICIDQNNSKERGMQISKMAQIYRQCTRVILYLGPDIAQILDDQFLLWKGFHKMDPESLKRVLMRRYFSRIWVIQELILAPRAVVRVDLTDFWIDSATQDLFPKWEETAAPWLQYATRQRLQVSSSYEALKIISRSQSTDPRDRLFGILGLLPGSSQLRPDYSLSSQHIWIGFFAHCLLRQNSPWFLFHATGIHHQSSIPSWIPQWNLMQHWEYITPLNYGYKDIATSIHKHSTNIYINAHIFHVIPNSKSSYEDQFNLGTSLCSRTGALLHLYLERLLPVLSSPVRFESASNYLGNMPDDYHIFKFNCTDCPVYLVSGVALDELVIPERDHIFLFHTLENVSIPLVLREHGTVPNDDLPVNPQGQDSKNRIWRIPPKQFRLVGACLYAFSGTYFSKSELSRTSLIDHLGCAKPKDIDIPGPVDLFATTRVDHLTGLPFLHQVRTVDFRQVQTPYSVLQNCRKLLDKPISTKTIYETFAGGAFFNEALKDTAKSNESLLYWALLPLIINLGPATSLFEESYLSYFDSKYEPKVDGCFFQVNVPLSMWPLDTSQKQYTGAKEYWSLIPEMTKSNAAMEPLSMILKRSLSEIFEEPKPKTICSRIKRSDVESILRFDQTDPNVEELNDLIRHPREEYKSFYLVPERGFVVDGRSYHVDIL